MITESVLRDDMIFECTVKDVNSCLQPAENLLCKRCLKK